MSEGFASDIGEAGPNREREVSAQKSSKTHPREPHEHYVEERWVSRRLFETRDFGPVIVDPFAGFGNVVRSARACGLEGYGSDLIQRAAFVAGDSDFSDNDWQPPKRAGDNFAIVGNPPFGGRANLIRACAEAAVQRATKVALLAPVARLNAAMRWLEKLPLREILFVTPRPSMWPGPIYAAKLAAGAPLGVGRADVCWLIFARGARGHARVGRLARDA